MVGQLGMRMAVQGNFRVAVSSMRNFGDALRIAYRSGTVSGKQSDSLGLLGFGNTLLAIFMRVSCGIYTKAASVGADQVGDNASDYAGMAADIFESYEVTIVSTLILGLTLMALIGIGWLTYAGNLVSIDSFGPISHNANGIGEMASMPDSTCKIMTANARSPVGCKARIQDYLTSYSMQLASSSLWPRAAENAACLAGRPAAILNTQLPRPDSWQRHEILWTGRHRQDVVARIY